MKINKNKQHNKKRANLLTIALLALIVTLVVLLFVKFNEYKDAKNLVVDVSQVETSSTTEKSSTPESVDEVAEEINNPFTKILSKEKPNKTNSRKYHDETQKIIKEEYNEDYLLAQDDILEAIDDLDLDLEFSASLFLPENPAQYKRIKSIDQFDIPLILQKDIRWSDKIYGFTNSDTIGEVGCALTTLAMLKSYFEDKLYTPEDIIKWSGTTYWVDGDGTSWQIFPDFAYEHGYSYTNYGNDFYSAMQALEMGEVVVASVNPGFFTDVGHFVIIRGYDPENGYVLVNDPNDNPEKMYSIQAIEEQTIINETANYWSFSN